LFVTDPRKRDDGRPWEVSGVALSADGKQLAGASGDPAWVTVWDIASHRRIAQFEYGNAASGICFSPDGKTLATSGADFKVKLWDLATGREMIYFRTPTTVARVQFSKDGNSLAAYETDRVTLYRASSLAEVEARDGR
jgi:WD40 repeat protein